MQFCLFRWSGWGGTYVKWWRRRHKVSSMRADIFIWTKRVKARLILIFNANTNGETLPIDLLGLRNVQLEVSEQLIGTFFEISHFWRNVIAAQWHQMLAVIAPGIPVTSPTSLPQRRPYCTAELYSALTHIRSLTLVTNVKGARKERETAAQAHTRHM